LFDAEREARRLHDQLVGHGDRGALVSALRTAVDEAVAESGDDAGVRLVCLARLLGELDGAEIADLLIDVLGSEPPEARNEAGEQLQGLAFDRFKEVALATERALERLPAGSNALVELPYLLVEIPEQGVLSLLAMFLDHDDADAVASAIEALAEVGDASIVTKLSPLLDDARVTVLGEEGEQQEATIGELASEAVELLSQGDEE